MGKIMTGKTCLVTGANSGIGKALSLALAGYGANVVMACRDQGRGEIALKEIKEKIKNPNLDLLIIDLSSQKSIRNGVPELEKKYNKLDVLINNAGVLLWKKTQSEDGIEKTFATNLLGPFLLTNLLLDSLESAAPSRIINVVSEGTTGGELDFDNLTAGKKYDPVTVYSQSKQAEILFTYELALRLKGTKISANCFYPGLVKTNLGKRAGKSFFRLMMTTLLTFMFIPIEESIKTGLFLAASKKAESLTGKYLLQQKNKLISKNYYDREAAKKLWQLSENLTHHISKGFPST
jgi:NAD(P)-dependent dehydrogenase (short-subunit alcohol dehydrogenase family)